MSDEPEDDPVEIPITDELDLHTFQPREVKDLVPYYLEECRDRGIHTVRVIHGKGSGTLRETVHALLRKLPFVRDFHLADEASGGWGATRVHLKPNPAEPVPKRGTTGGAE